MAASKTTQAGNLLQRAQKKAAQFEPEIFESLSLEETRKLLHELQVHHIQLEMQNEELRRAQSDLDAERANYFELYDLAPVGYLTVSGGGLILKANLAASAMLGVIRNRILNKPMSRFIYPADQDIYFQRSKQLIDSGELQNWEMRLKRVDGSYFWAELQSIISRDGEHWITLKDITDRKLAENRLLESEELFTQFMLHSPVHTYVQEITPTECRTVQCSESFQQMIGMSGRDMLGKTMQELFPPELAAKITADGWAVVSDGNVIETDEELNGRYYTTIKFPIVQQGRKLLAGYTVDITERKLAEYRLHELTAELEVRTGELQMLNESLELQVEERTKELMHSQSLMHGIINGTTDAIYPKDLQGRYVLVNSTIEKLSGRKAADLLGQDDYSIFPAATAAFLVEADRKAIESGGVITYENDIPVASGVKTFLATKGALVDDNGKPVGTFGISRDITERKQAESVMATRLRLMQFANSHSLDELLRATLDEAEALTGSRIGFYHFVDPDQLNITLQAWSTNTSHICKAEGSGRHYPLEQAGVWVDCIRERNAVIHNDYTSLPHRIRFVLPTWLFF